MTYGLPGKGKHVTIYANPGHAYMAVDRRRFDTSGPPRDGLALDQHASLAGRLRAWHPPGL